ncbi:MAG: hypothetical protein KKA07_16000 [Bacteroidetes bacterium]|nr:hypothetical protein [Bacteroidota bacterium]
MKTNKTILFFIAAILTACTGTTLSGYDFETMATYTAPESDVSVSLTATGHVNAGEDTGDGKSEGFLICNRLADTVRFKANTTQFTSFLLQGESYNTLSLANLFEINGYQDFDRDEVNELEQVILASACGPKGTYMEGQTKKVKVDKVEISR